MTQKIIIICGLPASGKTTLATELEKALGLFCLAKDAIKEPLFTSLQGETLEDSQKIGQATIAVLLDIADTKARAGVSFILEGVFEYEQDYDIFQQWNNIPNSDLIVIQCIVDENIRKERFLSRAKTDRHHAHHDLERVYQSHNTSAYKKMPGQKIVVDTNTSRETALKQVLQKLSEIS